MISDVLATAYLARIGASRPAEANLAALAELTERHVLTVPFENLDYHLGQEVHLDERVVEKIVHQGRGGACYEVNPAFGLLLEALGYQVEILSARVRRPDGLGAPLGHLALRVTVAGDAYLVDVGFRRNPRRPLLLGTEAVQYDPDGAFRFGSPDQGEFDLIRDGEPMYRVDGRARELAEFRPSLWWFRTCPDSPFLQDVFCSLPTVEGRVTLKGRTLTRRVHDEVLVEHLSDDIEVFEAYHKHFGITLDRLPAEPVRPEGSRGIAVE
ncbi:arylamine N-acetyltransferase [Streptomyces sp. NBC_01408]|uniref:arylamine N-acetyltransferase family protein n=1 Tax=Streptomyces sp. NBC_01408 TaxID=2903855 RepID=UPI002258732D|nr:arylamine N-acetyltransferase [Streptomyces sp. NBC_01408]MCX4696554.1 arylamine N-acetyltransferase [Streptomyces sp. NBC_01408]